ATRSRSTRAPAPTCRAPRAEPLARRTEQRRAAVFALYQHDLTGRPLDDLFEHGAAPFTRALAHATSDNADALDEQIGRHATGSSGMSRTSRPYTRCAGRTDWKAIS